MDKLQCGPIGHAPRLRSGTHLELLLLGADGVDIRSHRAEGALLVGGLAEAALNVSQVLVKLLQLGQHLVQSQGAALGALLETVQLPLQRVQLQRRDQVEAGSCVHLGAEIRYAQIIFNIYIFFYILGLNMGGAAHTHNYTVKQV